MKVILSLTEISRAAKRQQEDKVGYFLAESVMDFSASLLLTGLIRSAVAVWRDKPKEV